MAFREAEIRKLIRLLEESDVDEIEVSHWGTKIRVARRRKGQGEPEQADSADSMPMPHIVVPPKRVTEAVPGEVSGETEELFEIRSPMVGTFYRAASPDAEPLVQEGDKVTAGQVLCIIEAMKVMNQIESEVSGEITKVLTENATPVEYNQGLFLVKPA